jgi:recombination protein RecT
MSETLATALERSAQPKEAKTILDLIDRQKPELEKLLGVAPGVERFTSTLLAELRRTPKLYECDPDSLLGAMILAARLGLAPGPLGHVYLVPSKAECVFVLGYKGMVELAYRSGFVKDISTGIVHEGDAFAWREGTRAFIDHTPSGPREDRYWTHAYAVARLKTGGSVFRVIFPEDVEQAKARSTNATSPQSPWVTDLIDMIRKTAVRRLAPMLPQSPAFSQALAADEASEPLYALLTPSNDAGKD